jgi:hypothetical protein
MITTSSSALEPPHAETMATKPSAMIALSDLDIAVSCIVFALFRLREPQSEFGLELGPHEGVLETNYRDYCSKHTVLAPQGGKSARFVAWLHHG